MKANKPGSAVASTSLTVALITLGCSKNLVDAEYMSGVMAADGMRIVEDPKAASVIVVNTCGFIDSAKKEAIATILDMADYKQDGNCDFLIVTGCMAQRYAADIAADLPEVDAIIGTSHYNDIAKAIRRLYAEQGFAASPEQDRHLPLSWTDFDPDQTLEHLHAAGRQLSTRYYAYLKLAEGCSNHCTFCAIPAIRGPQRSRPQEELLAEAATILEQGISELILIAQDTTAYGLDLTGHRDLPELLRKLSAMPFKRIRFLYAYPDGVTPELLEVMASASNILHYLDLPVQHASDAILKRMARKDDSAHIQKVLDLARTVMPDICLRTTVMVGFPGETDQDFNDLLAFLKAQKFNHLGCFIFSPEEGTPASRLPDQVAAAIAQTRYNQVMETQQQILQELNPQRLNQVYTVLVESVSSDGVFYLGRCDWQAPEVDSLTHILAEKQPLELGHYYPLRIIEADNYDYTGVVES
ncbi:30S ribosomal protein S12 methylthiotransferase RimO [Oscillospiraceae bacterium HV4-5-C5C]|nr:30S ribosomal protein S12 methylthiotransferase RimO [Oscillospiraceae bacterium HV4-5-C5C]